MTRSDLNNWLIDLSEINSIYIFSGSEGLWFLISVVAFVWFILAIYRVEKNDQTSIEEELSNQEDLKNLIIEINSDEVDKNNSN